MRPTHLAAHQSEGHQAREEKGFGSLTFSNQQEEEQQQEKEEQEKEKEEQQQQQEKEEQQQESGPWKRPERE